ncbi:MAG TPA: TonB-dependent receptor [Allosphingosinicella sp.]|jgi:outer membrane receptor protein involved in Fe transport|nr:TonB-dependent receptor [Allosphingosinicella sp.]
MAAQSLISLLWLSAPASAAAGASAPPQEIVVTAPSLPGLDPARLPAASDTLDASDIRHAGTADLLRSLDAALPGVSLDEAQDNPWQPNLLYRGYEASPLGGDAQGLAVYVDGARFNQPFGDTANWELIPDIAVDRVTLQGSNPVFGLNALGGALAVDLKSGRTFQGIAGEASLGRFGRREAAAEAGARGAGTSFYIAGSVAHDDGWRDFSPSNLRQIYAQLGRDGAWGTIDLRLMAASSDLTGNGPAPVELLAARQQSVFTWPDETHDRYGRALLSGDFVLGPHLRLKPNLYLQRFRQRSLNGDLSDAEPCPADDTLLCLNNAPLTDPQGQAFAALQGDTTYAQLNVTRTATTGYGASLQLDGDGALAGLANRFALGAAYDGSRSRFTASSTLGALTNQRGFGDAQGVIDMDGGPIVPVDVDSRRDDIGFYAADTLTPLPGLDLTMAARYQSSSLGLKDRLGTALSGHHVCRRLNPSAGLVWRLGKNVSAYGGYAEANRAPTPAELSCADPQAPCSLSAFFLADPDLRQVVSRTWEAGLRGRTSAGALQLSWHAGGWRADNDDDIAFAASETRGRAFFRNIGRTRRQGVEAELNATAPGWSARLSYVLTDATYRSAFVLASPDNPAAGPDGTIQIVPGDRLPGIPRHRLKASLKRRWEGRGWIALDAQYASGRWLEGDEANLTQPTGAYWLADLSAGLEVGKRFELFAQVRNLFDRKYATFGTFSETSAIAFAEAPGISDPRSLSPGAPRTWLVGARAHF